MKLLYICEAIVDCPHSTAKNDGTGYPLIRTPNVGKGRLKLAGVHRVSENVYNLRNERAVPQVDDLILAREAPVGNVAIIRQGQQVCLGQRTVLIRPNKECVDPDFLVYYLLSLKLQHNLLSSANGATVSHLNMSSIRSLEVQVPDIEVQKRIGAILARIDDKIELNTAINENLEQQAQALFKAWFVDFEPFGGVMPDDWSKCILDSMFSLIIKGITPKYNEHSAQLVINQKCVRNHQIDLSLARCHEPKKVNEKWLQYGDIVVNSTGTGTLGRAAQVLFTPNNMTVDSHVTIIRASKQEYIYYLGLWATSHEHDFEMLQTGSTGQTDLPRERLKQMQIVLPSDSILSSFSKVIKPIADIRIQKQQENQRLSALRDTLLPKLMNGEIDVSAVKI